MTYDYFQKRTVKWSHAAAVLLLTCFHLFLVHAFYHNGLHRFTYDQIWYQTTPGAGDFPFSEGPLSFWLYLLALLFAGLGRGLLPFYALGIIVMLKSRWNRFSWGNRGFWLFMSLSATLTSISVWTMLGRSIAAWIID